MKSENPFAFVPFLRYIPDESSSLGNVCSPPLFLCANVAILENTIIPYSGILEDKIFFSKPKFPAPAGLSSIIITVPHPAIWPEKYKLGACWAVAWLGS